MKLPYELIKREVLVRKEAKTDEKHGSRPEERTTKELINYGIININKPSGPTSHQVSDYVKKILKIDKAGHSGSLDPKVTGVLPIALGKATRITDILLKTGKEYVALMHLHKDVEEKKLKAVLKEFVGEIKQLPPIKSAVKRQERMRNIYYLEVMEIEGRDVLFRVGCQAGTYIRKLIHDIGLKLGVGAHMAQLIRTRVASFTDRNMITLHDLKDAYETYKEGNEKELRKIILPIEKATEHLPKVWVFDSAINNLCHGADLYFGGISKVHSGISDGNIVAVMSLKGELVCLGKSEFSSEELLEGLKGVAVKTSKVFMEIGVYLKENVTKEHSL